MKKLVTIILAAGEGTRMKSFLPKVLHPLFGKPLLFWVIDKAIALHSEKVYVVINPAHKKSIESALTNKKNIIFVPQNVPRGTGDAVKQTSKYLRNYNGDCLILCGDVPLLELETLNGLIRKHRRENNVLTIMSTMLDNPYPYGRIVRDRQNNVSGIVEEKDAATEQRLIKEINVGVFCGRVKPLFNTFNQLKTNNKKSEYYLTDSVHLLKQSGNKIGSYLLADFTESIGINNRVQFAQATKLVQKKVNEQHMLNGVTVTDPDNTYIDPEIIIGQDTTILPGTIIKGDTIIGKNCVLGPQSYIEDCQLGNNVEVCMSHITQSKLGNGCKIGPFSHLRPGTVLAENVSIGNYSEIKNSVINTRSKVMHLSYIGDSDIGSDVNIGAGTITCNYDGTKKYRTTIEDKVFIGSNTNLVAPVKIGKNAVVGAGSTITENVPVNSLAVARARQVNKSGWQRRKK